jgi:DNA-binding beta-propeller fold protein YncE
MMTAVISVPNGQMATCWVAATPDGRYAYTSNAASGTITLYGISAGGLLRAVESVPVTGQGPMGSPIDIGVSRDGRNLYALNGNQGSVSAFGIGAGGRLVLSGVLTRAGLPSLGTQGIAVI